VPRSALRQFKPLHAQTKPPVYNIVEITIKDQDGYNKEYLPLITAVKRCRIAAHIGEGVNQHRTGTPLQRGFPL